MISAADQKKILVSLSQAAGDAATPDIYMKRVAREFSGPLQVRGGILTATRSDGVLALLASFGYPEEITRNFQEIPLFSDLPITTAARSGTLVALSRQSVLEKYPHLGELPVEAESTIAIPITDGVTMAGALGLTSAKPLERLPEVSFWEAVGAITHHVTYSALNSA